MTIFLTILAALIGVYLWAVNKIISALINLIERYFAPPKTHHCDGCGKVYDYPLHDYYGYQSCSRDCDEFLDEVFTEMQY